VRTIKLIVEYDGTGLAGWQRQRNGPSVQQHLEEALERMVGTHTPIQGASRTDAGVHAMGQVAHFRTGSKIAVHGFRRGLNSTLPPTIAVVDCSEAPEAFHARFDARGKHYRYTLLTRPERSPLLRDRAWHRPQPLDLDAMLRAALHMHGERDFSAFRAAGCTAATATRRVTSVEIVPEGPTGPAEIVHIHVHGNAFLRNMVRIMVGTLVAAGEGRLSPEHVLEILDSRDRARAGQTAPPQGLVLMQVFYQP
jgi:tRNA pseudouridine38-40 synthase